MTVHPKCWVRYPNFGFCVLPHIILLYPINSTEKWVKSKFNKDFLRFIPSFGRACTLKIRQEWTKNLLHMKYVPSITRKNTQNFGYPTTWSITNIHPSGRLLREKPTQFIQHIYDDMRRRAWFLKEWPWITENLETLLKVVDVALCRCHCRMHNENWTTTTIYL